MTTRNLVIVKLGGSVITYKGTQPPRMRVRVIERIAVELKEHRGRLLVVLGGGAHGHQAAHSYGFGNSKTPRNRLVAGIPVIRQEMQKLSGKVQEVFNEHGLPSVVVSPYMCALMRGGMLREFHTGTIRRALIEGLLVITHGDVCHDEELGASILSGDTVAVHLARELGAKMILAGTDVDGVLEEDPKLQPHARHIPIINRANVESVFRAAGPSTATDVTGGMARKVVELLEISKAELVQVVIFNLSVPGRLQGFLRGEKTIGTMIRL